MKRSVFLLALCASMIFGLLSPPSSKADMLQQAPLSWYSRFSFFKGKDSCANGDSNCNRCAPNVVTQFEDVLQDGKFTKTVRSWSWNNSTPYLPDYYDALDVMSLLPSGHFQSFVRVPVPNIPTINTLWASHSGTPSGIFTIDANSDPRIMDGALRWLYEGMTPHPGGMSAVGSRVLVPSDEAGAWLQIFNTANTPSSPINIEYPGLTKAANVAVEQLRGGGYLLLVNVSSYDNEYALFYTSSLNAPHLERVYWGTIEADQYKDWHEGESGFENLTMVTECGTGETFVVGASAKGWTYAGDSTWSLYALQASPKASLKRRSESTRDTHTAECDLRATGSAFVGPGGELAYYCHQKLREDDAKRNGIVCALGVGSGDPILGGIAAHFCADAISPGTDAVFTEMWPTIVSNPPPRKLTVSVSGEWSTGMVGVLEAGSGKVCETMTGSEVTCEWRFANGTNVVLIPIYKDDAWDYVYWEDTNCDDFNTAPNSSGLECRKTLSSDITVQLVGGKLI